MDKIQTLREIASKLRLENHFQWAYEIDEAVLALIEALEKLETYRAYIDYSPGCASDQAAYGEV
jgi:hypothetical protein